VSGLNAEAILALEQSAVELQYRFIVEPFSQLNVNEETQTVFFPP